MTIDEIKQLLAMDDVESVHVRVDGSVSVVKRERDISSERAPHNLVQQLEALGPLRRPFVAPCYEPRRLC